MICALRQHECVGLVQSIAGPQCGSIEAQHLTLQRDIAALTNQRVAQRERELLAPMAEELTALGIALEQGAWIDGGRECRLVAIDGRVAVALAKRVG